MQDPGTSSLSHKSNSDLPGNSGNSGASSAPASDRPDSERTAAGFKRFKNSSFFLVLLSVASGLFYALYALAVGQILSPRPDTNVLEEAALRCASELSRITVDDSRLGAIGLCDLSNEESWSASGKGAPAQSKVTGINSLYGSLRLDALIADKLKHPLIHSLLEDDFARARKAENELKEKLTKAVQKSPVPPQKNADFFDLNSLREVGNGSSSGNYIYQKIYRYLDKALAAHDCKLTDLSISLGFVRSSMASSQVRAPEKGENIFVDAQGQYRPGVPVAAPGFGLIMFTTLLNKTSILPSSNFVSDTRLTLPTAVLLDAVYEPQSSSKDTLPVKVRRPTCAAVGAATANCDPCALMIAFPHGAPSLFHCLKDILFYTNWQSQGAWRQAVDGEVPAKVDGEVPGQNRKGKLARPTDTLYRDMSPSDALAVSFYHWLRMLDPGSDLNECLRIISSKWSVPAVNAEAGGLEGQNGGMQSASLAPQVNSCLAKDSDARTASLLDKSYPSGSGQAGLVNVFAKPKPGQEIGPVGAPPSALPLFVDASGNCNLAGTNGFDVVLVRKFLSAVYDTNLAALESLWSAKLMSAKSAASRLEFEQKANSARQELSSINNRITLAAKESDDLASVDKAKEAAVLNQIELLKQRSAALQGEIAKAQAEVAKATRLAELAAIVSDNARRAIDATCDLAGHVLRICGNGIIALDGEPEGYLLSRKTCFIPKRKPLTEFDFLEAVKEHGPNNQPQLTWLRRGMTVFRDLSDLERDGDPNANELASRSRNAALRPVVPAAFKPVFVVLDSQSVKAGRSGKPKVYLSDPFLNIFIPKGQFIYYCQNAVETGSKPPVTWSVLLKDLVASKYGANLGAPVNSLEPDWCKRQEDAIGVCPGLACEFQLRTPLPKVLEPLPDTYVTNEAGGQIPQIPPVPPEML
jgi:hypothetical protein